MQTIIQIKNMTTEQKKKLLQRIADLEHDIEELKRVRFEVLSSGYSTASMSSTGGSKSFTRLDASKITETITQLQKEMKSMRSLLRAQTSMQINTIATIYS